MTAEQVRACFDRCAVARLATVSADGVPHVVPITFARLGEDRLVSAVDHKPKRTMALKRLANLAAQPRASLLVDHYEADWTALWWARADGRGVVLGAGDESGEEALDALVARYPQYRDRRPEGPVVILTVSRWSGWAATAG